MEYFTIAQSMVTERVCVLTGAGISLASGIPTYRTAAGAWARSDPITDQQFKQSEQMRARYWGRSFVGWPLAERAQPNEAHLALVDWYRNGLINECVTQNVDRLHQRAGLRQSIDLHGRLDRVVCLQCGQFTHRSQWQQVLADANPFLIGLTAEFKPDGDADLPSEWIDQIAVPSCHRCGGVLMPDVVFFGGNIPKSVSEQGLAAVRSCDLLMILGSSLQVYSGLRLCKLALDHGATVVVVNPGVTRADALPCVFKREPIETFIGHINAALRAGVT